MEGIFRSPFRESTIYRVLKAAKETGTPLELKSAKAILWSEVENNSMFVQGKGKSGKYIEGCRLSECNAIGLNKAGWEFEPTYQYTDDEDLENRLKDLAAETSNVADRRNDFVECRFAEARTDRSW